jgi:2-isopropylmalate synthase
MYNSTSPAQREIVFSKSSKEIIALAVDGIKMIRDQVSSHNGEIVLEYSPESFSQTELSFSSDICNAVIEAWAPAPHEQVIINLPSTVEISSPNVYADQIEYMSGKLIQRKQVIVSVHTHNDRGCAVAAAELAILAGADRVEGTLIGNGERTGNADLITLAMNLFSHGIETGLDFTNHKEISNIYTTCTGMEISQRHPYIGELVFTAFSGSHQDAISKGLHHYQTHKGSWNVPYLPIDPQDISRSYEAVIRINSQSGKGGSAYILEQFYGYTIPKEMHPELGAAVQRYADSKGTELSHNDVYNSFTKEFINVSGPIQIGKFTIEPSASPVNDALPRHVDINAAINMMNTTVNIQGRGNGFLDAFAHALNNHCTGFKIVSFNEHSLGEGSEAKAASYIQIENKSGRRAFGVGVDTDIACASLKALQNALNRAEI